MRGELKALRSEVLQRPADDPARLSLELLDAKKALAQAQKTLQAEQRARTGDAAQLTERILAETERANRMVIRATNAENELAIVKEKLAKAEATIEALRAGR